MKKSSLNYADKTTKGVEMSRENKLLTEIKALRQENKRLRKKLAKCKREQIFVSQESWVKSLDIIIRFLEVAKTTEIATILSQQGGENGSSNK